MKKMNIKFPDKNCLACGKRFEYSKKKVYCSKKCCSKHRDKIDKQKYRAKRLEYMRKWHKEHRVEERKKSKEYYWKNKKTINKQCTEYKQNNKEKIRAYKNKYLKNVNNKITHCLRSRINAAIHKGNKSKSTMQLLGCTIEELKQHLEKQFKPGMSWENYGYYGWHIDHIKPCASFDLTKESEQLECFHYSNLQPLWWKDNFSKGDKYE